MRHWRAIPGLVFLAWAALPGAAGAAEAFQARLAQSLAVPALRGAQVSALVVRESDGQVLFAEHPDRPMIPASNMKVLTAMAALSALGPVHRFETRILSSARPGENGRVATLYVQGGGDPVLNSEDWWRLVAELKREGVRRVTGDIVVDASAFDGQRWHPSWGRTGARAYHAPVSGLTANYASFAVHVRPGKTAGAPVEVEIDPPVEHLRLSNRARTGTSRSRSTLVVDRSAGGQGERVTVAGVLPAGSEPRVFYRSVLDPVGYAGSVLRWQLEAQGIAVDGTVRRGRVPDDAFLLLSFSGRPLSEIVGLFVKHSNNSVAEALVKSLGRKVSGRPGGWDDGVPALRSQLEGLGVPLDGLRIVDGSGLSKDNRLSPRALVEALRLAGRSFEFGPEVVAALPIAAGDGTLARRGKASPGLVRAKTGLLTRVTGLSGFARARDGERLVFSILVNGYRSSDEEAMAAADGFAAALTR